MKTYEYVGLVTIGVYTDVRANSQEEADQIMKTRKVVDTDNHWSNWVGCLSEAEPYDIYISNISE